MNIIQVHAPTSDKDDEEIESFYNTLDEIIKLTKRLMAMVIGHFM